MSGEIGGFHAGDTGRAFDDRRDGLIGQTGAKQLAVPVDGPENRTGFAVPILFQSFEPGADRAHRAGSGS